MDQIRCHRCAGYCTSPKILNRVSGSLCAGTENDSVPARCLRTACALRPNPHVQGQRSQVSSQRGVAALRLRRQAQSRKAMTGSRKVQQVHGRQPHPNDDVLDDIGFLTMQTIPQFACPEAHKQLDAFPRPSACLHPCAAATLTETAQCPGHRGGGTRQTAPGGCFTVNRVPA